MIRTAGKVTTHLNSRGRGRRR